MTAQDERAAPLRSSDLADRLRAMARRHAENRPHDIESRRRRLAALRDAIARDEGRLLEALRCDLGKPATEAYASEIGFVLSDIDHALRHLAEWTRPRGRRVPWAVWPARGAVVPEPLGVVLIMGPWNYPVQLLLSPLVGALAAGNAAVLKPSELAPATSAVVAELVAEVFDPIEICVVEGGPDVAAALTALPFDHIFFTGGTEIGRRVMAAAARNLTPVTLELGGKSPCFVLADADIPLAARRIAWGKFMNAGQTCVAPDYVLVHRLVAGDLIAALRNAIVRFYGDDPRRSADYGRIVGRRHFDRLVGCLEGAGVAAGGDYDAESLYFAPTVLTELAPDAPAMREEIFGPILPVVPFDSEDQALALARAHPRPLALYIFTRSDAAAERILAALPSGGACINDTISHIMPKSLPFGGIGPSGMGAYHGRASFDCFTHYRSVLQRGGWPDLALRYPPFGASLGALKRIYGFLMKR